MKQHHQQQQQQQKKKTKKKKGHHVGFKLKATIDQELHYVYGTNPAYVVVKMLYYL